MSNIMTSGIMYGDISDHLPIFVTAPIKQSNKFVRDMSNLVIRLMNLIMSLRKALINSIYLTKC